MKFSFDVAGEDSDQRRTAGSMDGEIDDTSRSGNTGR
jgi:hypothetical protein